MSNDDDITDIKNERDDKNQTSENEENRSQEELSFEDIAFTKNNDGEKIIIIHDNGETHKDNERKKKILDKLEGKESGSDHEDIEKEKGSLYESILYNRKLVNKDTIKIWRPEDIPNAKLELEKLIGLKDLKKQISFIEKRVLFEKKRQDLGLEGILQYKNHFVFTGNPGTGKNEVARIMGALFKNIGLLSKGHVIEVDRSDLVAAYVGQSAIQTKEIIEMAKGGILFIDEAYTLWQDTWDFGYEVISTLMKEMEDITEDFVVVLAGYKDKMEDVLNSNPGLKSRIQHHLHFPDYSPTDLMAIFQKISEENHFVIHKDATIALQKLFNKTMITNQKFLGNGRLVRNIFEKTIERMAARVIDLELAEEDQLKTILFSDIPTEQHIFGKNIKSLTGHIGA